MPSLRQSAPTRQAKPLSELERLVLRILQGSEYPLGARGVHCDVLAETGPQEENTRKAIRQLVRKGHLVRARGRGAEAVYAARVSA